MPVASCFLECLTLGIYQAIQGKCTAVLAPGHYTHRSNCPHIVCTLQVVVNYMGMPMLLLGHHVGTSSLVLVWGPKVGRGVVEATMPSGITA